MSLKKRSRPTLGIRFEGRRTLRWWHTGRRNFIVDPPHPTPPVLAHGCPQRMHKNAIQKCFVSSCVVLAVLFWFCFDLFCGFWTDESHTWVSHNERPSLFSALGSWPPQFLRSVCSSAQPVPTWLHSHDPKQFLHGIQKQRRAALTEKICQNGIWVFYLPDSFGDSGLMSKRSAALG